MRIFYDAEFIDKGRLIPLQLVSIGCVREDGAEWYGINAESLSGVVREPWVAINVVPHLPIRADPGAIWEWDQNHPEYKHVLNFDQLAAELRGFLTEHPFTQLWADFAAYDHVILAQIFGPMAELPSGIPMWTHELQQLAESRTGVKLPPVPERNHHALEDARWCRDAYNALMGNAATPYMTRPIGSEVPSFKGKGIEDAEVVDEQI